MKYGFIFPGKDVDDGFGEDHGILPRGVVQMPRPRERRPLLDTLVSAHCLSPARFFVLVKIQNRIIVGVVPIKVKCIAIRLNRLPPCLSVRQQARMPLMKE